MIAADTSAWIDYSKGIDSEYAIHLQNALASNVLVMPEPVLFEVLSAPNLSQKIADEFLRLPRLEVIAGFWERAATLRGALLKKGLKARGMDCLIARNCMDHKVPLICRDKDFRHFMKYGLNLVS
jgi:predicted nucleic acid-binding protein